MKIYVHQLAGWCGLLLLLARTVPAVEVEATTKPSEPWRKFPTRVLSDLGQVAAAPADSGLDRYGGFTGRTAKATGFFHTAKLDGRWWLVDPDGGLFIHRGVATVRVADAPLATAALNEKFGSSSNWAEQTTALLREHGFTGASGWSDTERLRKVSRPLVYNRLWSFMATYARKRGGTFQQAGHLGYTNDCIFVFDPEFEQHCDEYAKELASTKDDPWLLGHFSDNEMPLPHEAMHNYLKFPATDPGHQAALKFLHERHGAEATVAQITARDETDFHELAVGRYFAVVSRAIKKYDPNHLYLGSRFYGPDMRQPEIFRACGPHVDVVSVNYYRAWTPDAERLAMWERESGKPVLITEWYAKGADSGMGNTGGAGWLVRSQRDRGLFYQNFALALLESKVGIGWDWFRYMDNDPEEKRTDPSNRDSNKGLVNNRYVPYEPLLDAMQELNVRAYAIVNHFDGRGLSRASERRPGEKGE